MAQETGHQSCGHEQRWGLIVGNEDNEENRKEVGWSPGFGFSAASDGCGAGRESGGNE